MESKQTYHALLAEQLIAEFAQHGLEGYYCASKEQALAQALALLPREAKISCGGSLTLEQMGLLQALRQGGYDFVDPKEGQGAGGMDKLAHQALGVDYFLMSANAIAATGELVNADGYGNRVAALIFGPQNVLVIAGMNKVEPDLHAAIVRAKNYAAQQILLKFKPDSYPSFAALAEAAVGACNQLVITYGSSVKGRIKVILVGEELGL